MIRASEGGHWYKPSGEPMYEVAAKDGSMRPCTLRDARKLGLFPGVTSIIKCAAAPGLIRWQIKQAVMSALTLPGEHDDAFVDLAIADSQEQGRKAREKGTQIHAAIQGHYEGKAPDEEFWPFVQGVIEHMGANFPGHKWEAERPCAHPLGYGTKADLSSDGAVIDFKGSEFMQETMASLKTWDEHHMQLAATRRALQRPNADCAIVYVSRTVPGLCRVIRVDESELSQGLLMFDSLHSYWKAKNKYWPEQFAEKEAA